MSDEREVLLLRRDVVASMVPSGARIVLQEGSEVTLTQAKGNSYTLEVFGNLVRLDGVDQLLRECQELLTSSEQELDQQIAEESVEETVEEHESGEIWSEQETSLAA